MILQEKIEQSIKYLNAVKAEVKKEGESYICGIGNLPIHTAIQALKKQIPKKPVPNKKDNIRFSLCYNCPECGRTFSGTGIADYCYHCGQALDWSDTE